jgi:hypothetical protein
MYAIESPIIVNSLLPIVNGFGGVDSREFKNLKITLITINNVKINKKNWNSFIPYCLFLSSKISSRKSCSKDFKV